jgi:hypothetical protein
MCGMGLGNDGRCGCDVNCGNRVVQSASPPLLEIFFTGPSRGWGVRAGERTGGARGPVQAGAVGLTFSWPTPH